MWHNKGMNEFLCPVSAAALCHGQSPELHPSSAAGQKLCCRDTRSYLGLACVLHPPSDAASLRNDSAANSCKLPKNSFWQRPEVTIYFCEMRNHTVFIFLHLHAAVVNALDAAQTSHLFINTQILPSGELKSRANSVSHRS